MFYNSRRYNPARPAGRNIPRELEFRKKEDNSNYQSFIPLTMGGASSVKHGAQYWVALAIGKIPEVGPS